MAQVNVDGWVGRHFREQARSSRFFLRAAPAFLLRVLVEAKSMPTLEADAFPDFVAQWRYFLQPFRGEQSHSDSDESFEF